MNAKQQFPGGVWPVMLTPFTKDRKVDETALRALVDWYIAQGVSGLFAVCQSSEMFCLTLEERMRVARTVVSQAGGRVPVIASGHISDAFVDQVTELRAMTQTGVDALVLITNRMADQEEDDAIWLENAKRLIDALDPAMPLGFYECPYPYKRLLTSELIRWAVRTDRFTFLKDTCCDIQQIKEKLDLLHGTKLKLYNANTTTLLDSLRYGAAGYSGVMANFHPSLYAWLCDHIDDARADALADMLSIASLIERQCYPVNAKYGLHAVEGLPIEPVCRVREETEMTDTFRREVEMLGRMVRAYHL